jgi:hypothetical protein
MKIKQGHAIKWGLYRRELTRNLNYVKKSLCMSTVGQHRAMDLQNRFSRFWMLGVEVFLSFYI